MYHEIDIELEGPVLGAVQGFTSEPNSKKGRDARTTSQLAGEVRSTGPAGRRPTCVCCDMGRQLRTLRIITVSEMSPTYSTEVNFRFSKSRGLLRILPGILLDKHERKHLTEATYYNFSGTDGTHLGENNGFYAGPNFLIRRTHCDSKIIRKKEKKKH